MLSLLASLVYLAAAALSGLAALARFGGRNQSPVSRRSWLFIAAFFVLLAAMRLSGAEEAVREFLRGWLVADGEYASRRAIQAPIVAIFVCVLAALAFWARRASASRGRARVSAAVAWAWRGVAVMAVLIMLRLISFHPIDGLLYGRLRLNWILDIGSTVLVAACAIVSMRAAFLAGRAGATGRASAGRSPSR
jgi:hypothetical protein